MKKNIVISGISRGIGKAIACLFAEHTDWNIHGFARNIDTSLPNTIHISRVNAQDPEQIKAFCHTLTNTEKYTTDILVNNVGIYEIGDLFSEPDAQWHKLFDINLNAAYYLTKYLYPTFKRGTHIFNICSIASKSIVKEAPSYSVSKMALYGLHQALQQELEPIGIKVTAILPGAVYTSSWKDAPLSMQEKILPAQDIATLIWDIYHLAPQSAVKEIEIQPLN